MSTSAGEVTPVKLAVILLVPVPTPVANPAALIVATVVVAEFHITWLVMFAVVVSLYVPVAVNCCVLPLEIDGLTGVIAMDFNVAAVTVRTSAGDVTPVRLAVILLVPVPTPVASPVALIVATVEVAEFHVTWVVIFAVLVSL